MPVKLDAVEADALQLSPEDRAELIERLLVKTQPMAALHPAWEEEIARRVREMDEGPDDSIPSEQVFAELRSHIRAPARKA